MLYRDRVSIADTAAVAEPLPNGFGIFGISTTNFSDTGCFGIAAECIFASCHWSECASAASVCSAEFSAIPIV